MISRLSKYPQLNRYISKEPVTCGLPTLHVNYTVCILVHVVYTWYSFYSLHVIIFNKRLKSLVLRLNLCF